jgi:small subunit ribosomal protein S20
MSGDLNAARAATELAISTLDKAAEKGIIHRNNAARRKSRLLKRLNKIAAVSPIDIDLEPEENA